MRAFSFLIEGIGAIAVLWTAAMAVIKYGVRRRPKKGPYTIETYEVEEGSTVAVFLERENPRELEPERIQVGPAFRIGDEVALAEHVADAKRLRRDIAVK